MPFSKGSLWFTRWLKKPSRNVQDDVVEVFYRCDKCFAEIVDGQSRYNCAECVASYDLCEGCYAMGAGEEHVQECGPLHTFTEEKMSDIRLSTKVKAERLEDTFRNMFHYYSGRPAFGCYDKLKNTCDYITFGEVYDQVRNFAAGLKKLLAGHPSPMVSMCSVTRPEWYITDYACLLLGIPTVPLGANADSETVKYILNQAEVCLIVCSREMTESLLPLLPDCSSVRTLVMMDSHEVQNEQELVSDAVKVVRFSEVSATGRENPFDLSKTKFDPTSVYTISFTSGSTGKPKGCIFTRSTWNARISRGFSSGFRRVWLSFHPPSHNLERGSVHVTLGNGGKVGFYRGSMEHLLEDFALVRPTVVASTPRLWTMLYNQYLHELYKAYTRHLAEEGKWGNQQNGQVNDSSGNGEGSVALARTELVITDGELLMEPSESEVESEPREKLEAGELEHTHVASETGHPDSSQNERSSTMEAGVAELTDLPGSVPLLQQPSDGLQGDAISTTHRSSKSGSTATHDALLSNTSDPFKPPADFNPNVVPGEIKEVVLKQFRSVLGGREQLITTGGAPTGNQVKQFMMHCFKGIMSEGYGATEVGGITNNGTVLPRTKVKLMDVPEMGYFTSDDPPRGEICVKSPAMIDGYYKNSEETAKKFVDGYFRTGDIGTMDTAGNVVIIDRKKNIFKLAQGEFVAPERLEVLYVNKSSLIEQMYVYGNSLQSNVVAVVVPVREWLEQLWKGEHLSGLSSCPSIADVCQDVEVRKLILWEIRSIAKSSGLQGWEVPVGVVVEPEPFSIENGLLTSTLKQCRPKLEAKYRVMLEAVYQEMTAQQRDRPLEISVLEQLQQLLSMENAASPTTKQGKGNSPLLQEGFQTATFSQLGGDSLAAMRLSALVKEHLHAELSVEAILKQPLGKILEIIGEQQVNYLVGETHVCQQHSAEAGTKGTIRQHQTAAEQVVKWEEEISLEDVGLDQCQHESSNSTKKSNAMEMVVFLTGVTGFLGRFILVELLQQCSKVYCLVKSKQGQSAEERIFELLMNLRSEFPDSLPSLEDLQTGKMIVLEGDLSLPNLGLRDTEYSTLCSEVDIIIHNGAIVNAVLPYAALKCANVDSTKEVMRIACTVRPKFLHYVSTIGVFAPCSPSENIREDTPPSCDRLHVMSGYAQSKWVSERLVLQAIHSGILAGNVSRPGLIGPHTVTGHANMRDWVCWLVRGLAELGVYPVGVGCDEKEIYWVPVDQVAKAVVLLSLEHEGQQSAAGEGQKIFHLVNSITPVKFNMLAEALKTFVAEMNSCGYGQFRRELSQKALSNAVLGSLDLLLPAFGGWPRSHVYSSDQTRVVLSPRGVALGVLPEGYVEQYLHFLRSRSML